MSKQPPLHLSDTAKAWWRSVVKDFDFEDHHFHLLKLACEALDRAEEARKILETEGLTFKDRFGQPVTRPEVRIEKDSRAAYAALVKQLDLNEEPATILPGKRAARRGIR